MPHSIATRLLSTLFSSPISMDCCKRSPRFLLPISFILVAALSIPAATAADPSTLVGPPWRVGFGKVDVTPEQPLRLSGYAVRVESSTGVRDPLHARAMVLSPAMPAGAKHSKNDADSENDAQSLVLVSLDSIAVTSQLTVKLAQWLKSEYGLPRSQFVLSSTHSHAAPHLSDGLENLFGQPSTAEQLAGAEAYTQRAIQAIQEAVRQAMQSRSVAKLSVGESQADFAVNRRVIQEGRWTGFGEQKDAPTDQRVRVLVARGENSQLLGAAYLYACHCTTLGSDFNEVSGDWAGLSASQLEKIHAGCVFLPVIGCGADANPNPRGSYEHAVLHAAKMTDAVQHVVMGESTETDLAEFPEAHFGFAGLAPEQPTRDDIEKMLNSENPNERRWAEHMQKVAKEMGRLPESYPMPIHTWQFGDQLTWVFLGGEVVVDYALQLEKEFQTDATWVAAYCDDVFAYVACESMRGEGGYEVDFSMIYYLQPGRWQSGTQSQIIRRALEIAAGKLTETEPLGATEALRSIRVPPEYRVELVAAEPLVRDPINLAFGLDGRLWVVEMADYPEGVEGGGRVKWLRDHDGDGQMDEAVVFASRLSYPTSVMPYRDGVIVVAAPHIIWLRDEDGDGRSDQREILLDGIGLANPQHRASGFEIGLDGWIHFAAGDHTPSLHSSRNGQTLTVRRNDIAWHPDTGELRATAGPTQFVRSRDSFGNWFGNNNSEPMFHYVIEERYGRTGASPEKQLFTPPVAPPVFPGSQTADRFNDLHTRNRFTSACSSLIVRNPSLADCGPTDVVADEQAQVALICEPVHNLVARAVVRPQGATFRADRHPDDERFDFFTSTDPFSRPVRVVNAPDGSVWIVDMVRKVIEHPEWIPTTWQSRLDVRSGSSLGRIYRVYHRDLPPTAMPRLVDQGSDSTTSVTQWEAAMTSEIGALRDLALQYLLESNPSGAREFLTETMKEHGLPVVRAAALGGLAAKKWLDTTNLAIALDDPDPRIVRLALEFSEELQTVPAELQNQLAQVASRKLGPAVDLQWLLTTSRSAELLAASQPLRDAYVQIVSRSVTSPWLVDAIGLQSSPQAAILGCRALLTTLDETQGLPPRQQSKVETCIAKFWKLCSEEQQQGLIASHLSQPTNVSQTASSQFAPSQLALLAVLASDNAKSKSRASTLDDGVRDIVQANMQRIRSALIDETSSTDMQLQLVKLIGGGLLNAETEQQVAAELLLRDEDPALQIGCIESLGRRSDAGVASLLLDSWSSFSGGVRSRALGVMLSRRTWVAELVGRLEAGQLSPSELDLASIEQLRVYPDRELRNRCTSLFAAPDARSMVVQAYLRDAPAVAKLDLDHNQIGKQLFDTQCAVCHVAQSGRPAVGPSLDNLGHWTTDQWFTSILDPNQTVEPKYAQTRLLTHSGQVMAGIVIDQGESQWQIATSDGDLKTIATNDIELHESTSLSLMPEGFEQRFTPEQLSRLIQYIINRDLSETETLSP